MSSRALRVFSGEELERISTSCRGYLLQLEQQGILSPLQREIVIDRLVALDGDEVDIDRLKWLVLMVLSSQPGQEQACARMEDLVFDAEGALPN
jgi:Smg protein